MSSKLSECFNKFNRKANVVNKYNKRKAEIENLLKDNELFTEYLEVLKNLEEKGEELKQLQKEELQPLMEGDEVDYLEGTNMYVTRKKSYYRDAIDVKKFISKYPIGTKMYKTWVTQTYVKGSVKLTWKEESTRRVVE